MTTAQHLFQPIRVHTAVEYSIEERGEGEGAKRRGSADDCEWRTLSRCVTRTGKFYFTIESDYFNRVGWFYNIFSSYP